MDSAIAYYERRIAEELVRAQMALGEEARSAHSALANHYQARVVAERMRALESYRAHLAQQCFVSEPRNLGGRGAQ